jgi:hypothetical protein
MAAQSKMLLCGPELAVKSRFAGLWFRLVTDLPTKAEDRFYRIPSFGRCRLPALRKRQVPKLSAVDQVFADDSI